MTDDCEQISLLDFAVWLNSGEGRRSSSGSPQAAESGWTAPVFPLLHMLAAAGEGLCRKGVLTGSLPCKRGFYSPFVLLMNHFIL